MKPSRLLALPKELRLEIWRYALQVPVGDKLVVCIERQGGHESSSKRFCNSLYKYSKRPEINAHFEACRSSFTGVNLLRVNHLIYEEALPMLYRSVVFRVRDLQGIFPLFLENLSVFARSCIRFVRLVIHDVQLSKSSKLFYWALTCAQVAQLNESLQHVEIEGRWAIGDKQNTLEQGILNPLLKIKASKTYYHRFGGEEVYQDEFQKLLFDAAREPAVRGGLEEASAFPYPFVLPSVDEREIAHDLALLPGIDRFERELLEWDMVSVRSGPPTPPPQPVSTTDEDTWIDNASTVVAEDKSDGSSDKDIDDWELVDKPSSL
ncbi:hypothetical protein EK21DRAFT_105011 [Setomelanomma holmii]|uniref:DUF7730 domain-containing protein n=1 Tax=Setomelanomma holmii TaxID=210430 RepID=A0A9P4GYP2_9PLEO|nr:hypothetical protein EK21DRAFT_105011 [Setomelanomma holmii]